MRKIIFLFILTSVILMELLRLPPLSYASYQELGKTKLLGPVGYYNSQYSPWVMHQPGWESYVMYYCKNTPIKDTSQDRVWRIENWNDGISGSWISDQVVIEGTVGQNDDLSCSPGVVIDNQGKWHMYYVTANRNTGCDVYLYHAVADAPGVTWTKKGVIKINGVPMSAVSNCALDTPSPFFINGKYIIYYSDGPGKLVRLESTDGHNFTNKTTIILPDPLAGPGRLIIVNGEYYYVYGRNPTSGYLPPIQILISKSLDGNNFSNPELLMSSSGSDWDGERMWSPSPMVIDNELRIYYAGNLGNYDWWGSNSSIGVRWFNEPFSTPTPTPTPGDANGDGKVDGQDYIIWLNNYSQTTVNGASDGDFNENGKVDGLDYVIWLNNYQG